MFRVSRSKPGLFQKLKEHIARCHKNKKGQNVAEAITNTHAGLPFTAAKIQADCKPAPIDRDPLYFSAARVFPGNALDPCIASIDKDVDDLEDDDADFEDEHGDEWCSNDDDL